MTEEQVELRVEVITNRIDRAFTRGAWTQAQYDQIMRDLNKWAERALRGSTDCFVIREFA